MKTCLSKSIDGRGNRDDFRSLGEIIVLSRLICINVLVLCILYFFISRLITLSGLRVIVRGRVRVSVFDFKIIVWSGKFEHWAIFDSSFLCRVSDLFAILILDWIVLRRIASFFHFSCVLKFYFDHRILTWSPFGR